MTIISAKLITPEDALQTQEAALIELSQYLRDAGEAVEELSKSSTISELALIKNNIERLQTEIHGINAAQANIKELVERTKAFYILFERLDENVRLSKPAILAETSAVMAHVSARRMLDAAAIIEVPARAISSNGFTTEKWTFLKEYERIAAELQAGIPFFLGYPVEVSARLGEILVRLAGTPRTPEIAGIAPLEQLKDVVERSLKWELRKTGFDMNYEIDVLKNPRGQLLICRLKPKMWEE